MEAEDRLIVALDFPSAEPALRLAQDLRHCCRWLKVGMELFYATGPSFVDTLRQHGFHVFLDLKLHDIPNTVAGGIRSAAQTGASLVTIHAAGGLSMMRAAVAAANACEHPPGLLAVTLLTSMDRTELTETGVDASPEDQVLRLAELAVLAGVPGLVCSTHEVAALRQRFGPELQLVTPGIRPNGAFRADQKRVATPEQAIRVGASRLVVGRPITEAEEPRLAADQILREIAAAEPKPD